MAATDRPEDQRIVQWLCGDDEEATSIVAGLIEDAGYVPVNLGAVAGCAVMEAPRRPGAVYGEEWRLAEARGVVEAVSDGRPIPATLTTVTPGGSRRLALLSAWRRAFVHRAVPGTDLCTKLPGGCDR